jgi:hypothetical protein
LVNAATDVCDCILISLGSIYLKRLIISAAKGYNEALKHIDAEILLKLLATPPFEKSTLSSPTISMPGCGGT